MCLLAQPCFFRFFQGTLATCFRKRAQSRFRALARRLKRFQLSSFGGARALAQVDLPSNNLTGALPSELGLLAACTTLDLSLNHLTSHLPTQVGCSPA